MSRLDPRRVPTVVLLLAPLVLLLLIVGLLPESTRLGFAGDLSVYRAYGLQLLQGSIPYRDFHVEYPPLALVPMALPLLAAPAGGVDDLGYIWRFTLIEGGLAVAAGWLIFVATGKSRSSLVLWAVLVSLAWTSVALRYDLWPVLCVLVAVLIVDRQPGAAGVMLGIGTMLKLFPIAVLPVLGAWAIVQRDRAGLVRLVAGCTSIVIPVMAASWVLAGPASLQWLVYQSERGLQVESIGSGLLLGLHVLVGHPVELSLGYGSVQVRSPGSDVLVAASPLVLAVLLGVITGVAVWRFRSDHARLGQVPSSSIVLGSVAAIVTLLVGSKVLSVQYVIWFLPFVPLLSVRLRWLGLAIVALSTAIYTTDYAGLWHFETPMILALVARNALLVGFAAWLVVELWGGSSSRRSGTGDRLAPPAGPTDRVDRGEPATSSG